MENESMELEIKDETNWGSLLINKNQNISIVSVSFERASWKYTISSMFLYAFKPIILPIFILLSKILKRKIEWNVQEGGEG